MMYIKSSIPVNTVEAEQLHMSSAKYQLSNSDISNWEGRVIADTGILSSVNYEFRSSQAVTRVLVSDRLTPPTRVFNPV